MTFVILLDCYAGLYGDDQYAITGSGTLAYCRALTRHDGTTTAAPKSDYRPGVAERASLLDPMGLPNPGTILQLITMAPG